MEGIGGYVYRNAFQKYFGPIDAYISPFVGKGSLMNRERRDIDPENNKGICLIPQIMGGDAEGFLKVAKDVAALGYSECNINLGCPSGTVTGRGRGSGMLKDPERLDAFLDKVCGECSMKLSVKTRVGFDSTDKWESILNVLSKYPFESVTIHPRTASQQYGGKLHMDCFKEAYEMLKVPLIFNGEILSAEDAEAVISRYPALCGIMIGRGFIKRPQLACEIAGRKIPGPDAFISWHRELVKGYGGYLSGEKSLLFKMKDLWNFYGQSFEKEEKSIKKMKKTGDLSEFTALAEGLLRAMYVNEGGSKT